MDSLRFTLYSRTYCHLCDDMLQALRPLLDPEVAIEVVDVDADSDLLLQYDELVPVLTAARGDAPPRQLCHYFLNENAVLAFLAEG
jgi:hypothetical protein